MLPAMAAGQQLARVYTPKGEAVEDAIIVYHPVGLKSFQKVAITNSAGKAVIEADADVVLVISKMGYTTLRDTLSKGRSQSYTLVQNNVNLKDVVVTGQFETNTSEKAVQQIRVIDRKRIEQQGAVSLRDVLTNELNIRVTQDAALGSQMTMMGLGGQNVKILIDGVPVIGRMDGNIDLSQINLSNIERIEIIQGPMSVIYGTDALGGVINLISKKPTSKQYTVSVNSYFETVGTYNFDANAGFKYKGLGVTASGGRNYFDGFSTVTGDSIRAQQWKPREQIFGDIQLSFKHKKQSHRFTTQAFNETIIAKGNPDITPYSVTAFDNYVVTNRMNYSLYSDFYFNNKASLNLINSYSTFVRSSDSYIKNLVTGSQQPTPNSEDHDTTTFDLLLMRATYTTHNTTIFNSQMGYDINRESVTGERIKDSEQSIGDYAVFYIAEIKPISKLTLNQGVRFIYNTSYGAPVIPSFNVKYDVTQNLAMRGSYAQGFRAPSLKELHLNFVDRNHNIQGNPDLKAETSHNFLLSATHTKTMQKVYVKTEVSGFYNHISDMIRLVLKDPAINEYKNVNIAEFRTHGMNLSSTIKYKNISGSLGYSLTGSYGQLNDSVYYPNYAYANEFKANATYSIPKTKTDFNIFCKYNGVMPGFALDANNNLYQTFMGAFTMLDASITQKFFKGIFSLTVGAKNLTNVTSIAYNTGASAHSSGSGNLPTAMGRYYFTSIRINIAKQ